MLSKRSIATRIDVRIDEGAYKAISRKESGGRLLPAGVVRVEGLFASHQAVRLVVRRRRKVKQTSTEDGRHRDSLDSGDEAAHTTPAKYQPMSAPVTSHVTALRHLQGQSTSTSIHPSTPTPIGSASGAASGSSETIQPETPHLDPVASLSSSIASLDPLSRSVPPSPAIKAISERLTATSINSALGQELKLVAEAHAEPEAAESEERQRVLDVDGEWEEVEVGKGLAQYNSVEIDRIKGRKR